ncbi:MAG: CsiV family protein [Pseudomonadales bacterium]|nr:CsiV family protein [Pseudomonadales bacterium]
MPRHITTLLLTLFTGAALAQDFSYDGNRWYEVEVSIFSNAGEDGPNTETTVAENVKLRYPARLRALHPATAAFMIDFENPDVTDSIPAPSLPIGPEFSSAANNFRLPDFSRDAFIALGPQFHKFATYNRRLDNAVEHRLLYHATWRQPMLDRSQTSAVFIRGGERYGAHNELEGSLMFSFNVNRVDLEARLWLSTFTPAKRSPALWDLPSQPFAAETTSVLQPEIFTVSDLAFLEQSRAMTRGTLHYLDHPDFGLLVEIRPYQLPALFNPEVQ